MLRGRVYQKDYHSFENFYIFQSQLELCRCVCVCLYLRQTLLPLCHLSYFLSSPGVSLSSLYFSPHSVWLSHSPFIPICSISCWPNKELGKSTGLPDTHTHTHRFSEEMFLKSLHLIKKNMYVLVCLYVCIFIYLTGMEICLRFAMLKRAFLYVM